MLRKAGNFLRYLFGILMMLAGSRLLERGEGICIVTAAAWNLFASGYLEYDKETVSCGESTSCAASCVAAGFRLCADTCDVQQ